MSTYGDLLRNEASVMDAAYKWWVQKRPLGWSEETHLNNPSINVTSDAERELALRVARWVISNWEAR